MPEPAVIFDLDDTLADTAELLSLRKAKKWKQCVGQLSRTHLYPGLIDAITKLRDSGIRVGIVTTSVSYYAETVLRHHNIPYDALVAYHDCPWNKQKPDPAPVNLCIEKLKCRTEGSLGIGDSAIDAQAYVGAGIAAWGAGWSSRFEREAEWAEIIETPEPIMSFFESD